MTRQTQALFVAALVGVLLALGVLAAALGGPIALGAYAAVVVGLVALSARRTRGGRREGATCACCTSSQLDDVTVV